MSYTALETAIYLLSRRDHGQFELTQKLSIKGYPEEEVHQAVMYCLNNNYLNDLRYAKSQVRQHINKGHGERRIRQELLQKRVEESVVDIALEEEATDWFDLARQVAEKKFKGKSAEERKEYARQVRFLQYRGFTFEQIDYALNASGEHI
ncbi:recombination regulator RecX [Vibrio albus]|jgi:regulatory protein|uniref:Regulatory protein RecX n=1 Tax=Vibrio albus TaxID=2200953 RepID=A0A2U3B5X0_9VIBR|nr:recombination regulator RecX [Vibrio albus]PWI32114.1 recombination regulator RecX [Vibrio albus]